MRARCRAIAGREVRGGGAAAGAAALSLSLIMMMISIPVIAAMACDAPSDGVLDALPWWQTSSRDMDRDSVDDELENVISLGLAQDGLTRVFIDMDHGPDARDEQALSALGARIIYRSHYLDTLVADIPATDAAVSSLLDVDGVVMIEACYRIEKTLDTSRPSIGIDTVWTNYSYKGEGIVVAVIDTGIDANHTGLDDMDDIASTSDPKVIAFYDALNQGGIISGTTVPYDDEGHGSHVSGIVSGTGDGSFDNETEENRYTGVAPETFLVGVKVIGPNGGGADTAMTGIEWAMDNADKYGIRVLSMSFGARFTLSGVTNDGTSAISRLCDRAVEEGLNVVVAAGNDGPRPMTIAPPGDARNVITVGNVYDSHGLNPSSSRGPVGLPPTSYTKPDVCAPGSDVWSVKANTGNEYVDFSGTSMAAPHVSGFIAIMLQANPSMDPNEVKGVLTSTADGNKMRAIDSTPNNDYGYGVINPVKALEQVTGGMKPPSVTIAPMQYASGLTMLSGTATASNGTTVESVEVRIGESSSWKKASWDPDYKFWSHQWNTNEVSNGDLRVYARSFDGERYSATDSRKVTVNNLKIFVDTTDPAPEHSQGEYHIYGHVDGIYVKDVVVEFTDSLVRVGAESTAGDARDDYQFKTWHAVVDLEAIGPGTHTYRVGAYNGKDSFKSAEATLVVPGDSGNGNGGNGGGAAGDAKRFAGALTGPWAIASILLFICSMFALLWIVRWRKSDKEDEAAEGRGLRQRRRPVKEAGEEEEEEAEEVMEVEAVEVVEEEEEEEDEEEEDG